MTRTNRHLTMSPTTRKLCLRRGSVLMYVTVGMVAFAGIVSLGIDVAHVRLVKIQLQNAADASARYAATGLATSIGAAKQNAVAAAADNTADGASVDVDPNKDVDFGVWDPSTRTFTVLTGSARSGANAVRVTCRRTSAGRDPVQLSFGGVIGVGTCDVQASSIAAVRSQTNGGIIGLNGISTAGGTTVIDSYNAANGPYTAGTADSRAIVASNSDITLGSGTTIRGDASPGPGDTVTGGTVTGSTTPLTAQLSAPPVSAGSYATSNDNANVSAYMNGGSFSLNGGSSATIPAGHYYFQDFSVTGGSTITVTGAVTIYIAGNMTVSGGSIDVSTPSGLTINLVSSGSVTLSGGSGFSMDLYAPQSSVTLSGGSQFYGSVTAGSLTLTGGSDMHYDESGNGLGAVVTTVQ